MEANVTDELKNKIVGTFSKCVFDHMCIVLQAWGRQLY